MKTLSIMLGASIAALVGSGAAIAGTAKPHPYRSSALGEVTFRFDSAALRAEAPAVLDKVAAFAAANPDAKIVLDAYTCPIGASDYNVGLAIRRAESVRAQLKATGVKDDQIVFAIYAEDGERRATYPEDRRVTLWATHQPLATVITRTFAGNGAAVTWQRPLTVAQIEGQPESVASR